ncbi:MAG TPA: lytic transglycosylase domain-containing protein [Chitinophagaceae bacterium]|nr:lytic transglycosylase domain-containing protein [Chitinophagaceae bacterium]
MNNILSKLLCGLFIVLMSTPAEAGFYTDSTKLFANNTGNISAKSFTRTMVKEANIIYPATLQANMDESLDYVQKFSNTKRNYLIRTYQKGKKYFPKIAAVLKRFYLPQELKVLIALESAFNANAVSGAGAVGYWQMMDDVAKEYGLHIGDNTTPAGSKNKKKDDRTNFAKSTLAAVRYLKDRAGNLNKNLLLMVASYNWGIGNVRNAMKRTGKSSPDFWDIKKYLPSETKAYVMNFIALNVIFENYDKFVSNKLVFNSENIEVPVTENVSKLSTSITE